MSGPPIADGVAVVLDGRTIAAVGCAAKVAVPAGAERIDALGLDLYPGFLNANTTLALTEIGPCGPPTTSSRSVRSTRTRAPK